jgi:hypothetical protein
LFFYWVGLDAITDGVDFFLAMFGQDTVKLVVEETNRIHLAADPGT